MAKEVSKIMVVDDEVGFTKLLKMNLEKSGRYEVYAENSGAQALTSARAWQPDLILLDVVMPDVDGGEVLAQLEADDQLKDIPVIFLTATMSRKGIKARGGSIGGQDFVAKPVDFKKLARQIDDTLNA